MSEFHYRFRARCYDRWTASWSKKIAKRKAAAGFQVEKTLPLRFSWRPCFGRLKPTLYATIARATEATGG